MIGHNLRKPVGPGDEIAVRVGREQRNVEDIHVGELDAEHARGLGLDVGPGADAAVGAVEQPAGVDGSPVHRPDVASAYSRRNTWCEACEV